VDMVPEFCAQARTNVEAFCGTETRRFPIEILLEDAVDYCKHSDDDIVFLYNPFPVDVLKRVISILVEVARSKQRPTLIIYTERIIEAFSTLEVLVENEASVPVCVQSSWGQSFHVFRLGSNGPPSP